jgi:hypothetical protein
MVLIKDLYYDARSTKSQDLSTRLHKSSTGHYPKSDERILCPPTQFILDCFLLLPSHLPPVLSLHTSLQLSQQKYPTLSSIFKAIYYMLCLSYCPLFVTLIIRAGEAYKLQKLPLPASNVLPIPPLPSSYVLQSTFCSQTPSKCSHLNFIFNTLHTDY